MVGSEDHWPGDEYFNDLSKQPATQDEERNEQRRASQDQVPKPKRIACVLCRKRKLKCDGNKPACGTCTRLQHDCSYEAVRRKSGPKRGYVKALEARLAQVETLLNTQGDDILSAGKSTSEQAPSTAAPLNGNATRQETQMVAGVANGLGNDDGSWDFSREESLQREMIGLGLDEPLPTKDVTTELDQGYFEKIHPSAPIIHLPRYYAAMNLAPHMRRPTCLRYAMWANVAAVMGKYEALQEHFYARARKYIQQDEMRGHGESIITIAHVQTWTLLAMYEFKLMFFPRAWMSSGRACRLAQMMGLHRLDGAGLDVKQCLPPPKDWTEREERRRTFWMCFCVDRYSSIGGWPMTIEERDIQSNLPGSEESYEASKPSKTMTLNDALEPQGAHRLSSFAGVVVMACLFGRNLLHLHRTSPDDKDDDLNGEFWTRHRQLDNILLNTALALPDALRMPSGLNNANVVFMNMNVHTSTICLHQAAIFKADKNRMPARISAESKARCTAAAAEIANIMRQISHLDMSAVARVFVQYMKSRPNDSQIKASLQFLLSAMHAIKRKNPLTESFLVQLDVDLEAAGLEDSRTMRDHITPQSDLPHRRRSPGSLTGSKSGPHKSPHSNGEGMDTSPENNSSTSTHMPGSGSSTQSGHQYVSSNTSVNVVSPPYQQKPGMAASNSLWTNDFGSAGSDFIEYMNAGVRAAEYINTDLNSHHFPNTMPEQPAASGNGFVTSMQHDATAFGGTGYTPGPTGFTPLGFTSGADGLYGGDMTGLSEEDWNTVMYGFEDWNTGVQPPQYHGAK
ncbi:hypothetical protein EJ03DRAFT_342143 [Teratosphaeria nubilosa]|uniref:Zn(2)-C6 fungal-type domain-containing protein n=1 Tax=Teratosphaeria nubilosa TaxID=161662 RepID=A0A6G1LFN9_9PEZI|nr:hypothetical protein EJ03DRAFT_342143 [Teratosphaeria nubilosa]